MKTQVKTAIEIEDMRISGRILAEILQILENETRAGVTTEYLDKVARKELEKRNASAAFLGYDDFPAAICISLNNEIVHGIPKNRKIIEGDLVGLDFGVSYHGMITDAAVTVGVGKISKDNKRLLRYTKQALYDAIDVLRDGVRVGDIGSVIEKTLESGDLKVVYALGGHGVGHKVHEDPIIPNYGNAGTGMVLKTGMTIALEPIATLGTHETYVADDHWTFMSQDGSNSSQFEHTILITPDGCEILTAL